eukprot:3343115-Alexandrium_andersonii.AAC.1
MRDLGAHLSLAARRTGKTVSDRLRRALPMVDGLATMPITVAQKANVAKSKCLAAALYGVEATPVAKAPLPGPSHQAGSVAEQRGC